MAISAVRGSNFTSVEAEAGNETGTDAGRVFWVVRASGPFYTQRTPPGKPPIGASTGYFVIDVQTGEIVGMGMP